MQSKQEKRGKRLATYVPDYVVFDLETTGTSVNTDEIIEISAVKVNEGEVVDTFSTLVNPQRSIPYFATAVNGITDEMVSDAPVLADALGEFLNFAGSMVLVGHNIQSFDLKFVAKAANELFGQEIDNDYIDTLYMARACLPELSHHRLTDISAHFQIDTTGAHRALNDCMMNQQCFEKMAQLQAEGVVQIELCPKCGGEMKKRKGKFGEFWGCSNFPVCRFTKNV